MCGECSPKQEAWASKLVFIWGGDEGFNLELGILGSTYVFVNQFGGVFAKLVQLDIQMKGRQKPDLLQLLWMLAGCHLALKGLCAVHALACLK